MSKLLIGIDFGTSTNYVTRYDFNKKDAVAVANMGSYGGSNIFDNCIYIENKDNYVVGDRKPLIKDPLNFFQDVKRHVVSDTWLHHIPNLDGREVTAQDIAEMTFSAIRKKVEDAHNEKIEGAVITVPYEFSDKYKKRITQAAENAGIRVIKLVEEPVAAAIAFGLFSDEVKSGIQEKVLVFDLGGGTFDVAIFKFKKSGQQEAIVEVLNTNGVEKLGGKNIDELLKRKFLENLEIDFSDLSGKESKKLHIELEQIARETKEALSDNEEWDIYETPIIGGKPCELEMTITRQEFDNWLKINGILSQIETALHNALDDIEMDAQDIDRVILAGGSSNIPAIKNMLKNLFGNDKIEAREDLGKLVGQGAGILAGLSEDNALDYTIIRKTSKSIGVNKLQRLQKILSKNIPYGEESASIPLSIKERSNGTVVFYEGESSSIDTCEKIGKIQLDATVLDEGNVKMSLLKEENSGMVEYRIYAKDNRLLASGTMDDYE